MKKKQMKKATPVVAVNDEVKAAKCTCEEGKCTCGCGGKDCKCGCGCGSNANGLLVLLGTILIAASILATPFVAQITRPHISRRPDMVRPAGLDKKAVEGVVRDYIKKNPLAIIESLDAFYREQQEKQLPPPPKEADAQMLKELLADKTNIVLGNPKGSFVMVEFFDYQCGHCKRMNKLIPEALKKTKNIRWVLMPLPIFGESSEIIARYAIASDKQGKFEKFHLALEEQKDVSEKGLIDLAKKLGLDTEKLTKDANSEEVKAKLAKVREYAGKLNTNGVPMFIINGQIQPGAFPPEVLDQYVNEANAMKAKK